MTSQINFSTIDTTFPIAGQDNDSQGFRDNFDAIKTGLATAKSEITDVQTRAVVVATPENTPATNDMNGSTIKNGTYVNLHSEIYNGGLRNDITYVDADKGDFQVFSLHNDITLNFRNWPVGDLFAKIRVQVASDGTGNFTPTISTTGGTITKSYDFPTPFTLSTDGTPQVIEAWTYNAGATVFVRHLGEYKAPSTDKLFTGNVTVEGTTDVMQLDAAALTVSGASSVGSINVESDATIGTLTVTGNSTFGNNSADVCSFVGIPVLPLLTTVSRDALTARVSMMIYNSTVGKVQVCTAASPAAVWMDL